MIYNIGMGECAMSDQPGDLLRTFALASCVAMTAFCPKRSVAGMFHAVLPYPVRQEDSAERPFYFVKTAIPALLEGLFRRHGCKPDELILRLYGGAHGAGTLDFYSVGKANGLEATQVLTDLGLTSQQTQLGGSMSRTLEMCVDTGAIVVKHQPMLNHKGG